MTRIRREAARRSRGEGGVARSPAALDSRDIEAREAML